MSVASKNLWWMLGMAAGGVVALLATTQNSKKVKKNVSESGPADRYSIKHTRDLYDDSETYYI